MIKYLIGFTILIILSSCEKEEYNHTNIVRVDRKLIADLNSKSIDTLIIEDNIFILDAYLWRDFMPISPRNGKPMISLNWLINIDSTDIPDNIDLIKQYVIFNDSIWISDYENETRPYEPDYKIGKVSREGPKWGPMVYVDVISNVYDSSKNKDYYIRTKNVFVERTD